MISVMEGEGMRCIERAEIAGDGIKFCLNEDGTRYEELVPFDRIKNYGVIMIFADKVSDNDADNWFLMDIREWLAGMGSVL